MLTSSTRSGTLTVAGLASQPGANLDHVAVSGTGLSAGNANVYADGSWARAGATLASGTNSYTATAEDTYGRTAQDSVTVHPVRCFCPWPSVGVTRRNPLRSWRRLEGLSHGVNLPATVTFIYDANGNLTGDGRRVFEYDPPHEIAVGSRTWQALWAEHTELVGDALVGYLTGQEKQLTNVYVASAWRESLKWFYRLGG